jgi:hypothetical protein
MKNLHQGIIVETPRRVVSTGLYPCFNTFVLEQIHLCCTQLLYMQFRYNSIGNDCLENGWHFPFSAIHYDPASLRRTSGTQNFPRPNKEAPTEVTARRIPKTIRTLSRLR